jgi:hypothetical protein
MVAMFVGGVILIYANFDPDLSPHFAQDRGLGLVPGLWLAMLVTTPVLALVSSALIFKGRGRNVRTLGLGLRLAADITSATTLWSYIIARLTVETYVMSGSLLVAVGLFSFAIVLRDILALSEERKRLQLWEELRS